MALQSSPVSIYALRDIGRFHCISQFRHLFLVKVPEHESVLCIPFY